MINLNILIVEGNNLADNEVFEKAVCFIKTKYGEAG